ncbi:CPXCG motif-containing cysteine-rich protein [Sessilibacter corallicola]|uniref:CPXCG motif-containing cysteine-rich protein n=1 Tax=Sessilibacter corallicola TaxID=2904075 RepID=UPI001E65BAE9|nr:CPXCG motif-containing cysteine-rich protein [Sessilibacter corallicola]MCE2027928.1 CPXCG motif-containing cysteine-rich protein [Sessilibacter corallicola]
MQQLPEQTIYCPYCGEPQVVIIDPSDGDCHYIEDCQVCCRPIEFHLTVYTEDSFEITVRHENE